MLKTTTTTWTGSDSNTVSVHREIAREAKIQSVIDALKTLSDADKLPAKAYFYASSLISELEQHLTSDVATRGMGSLK